MSWPLRYLIQQFLYIGRGTETPDSDGIHRRLIEMAQTHRRLKERKAKGVPDWSTNSKNPCECSNRRIMSISEHQIPLCTIARACGSVTRCTTQKAWASSDLTPYHSISVPVFATNSIILEQRQAIYNALWMELPMFRWV